MNHYRQIGLAMALLGIGITAQATIIKGKVVDKGTGEDVIGAFVTLREESGKGAVTGLDGNSSLSTTKPHPNSRLTKLPENLWTTR